MPNHKNQVPIRRGDVIHCPKCGEDYARAYRHCPFCAEQAAEQNKSGRRVANNRRGGGYGAPMSPIHIVMLLLSLALIIIAAFIVVKTLVPSLFDRPAPVEPAVSSSQSSAQQKSPAASGLTLDKNKITLSSHQTYQLVATVEPEDCTDPIQWSSSDKDVAVVDSKGLVTNANTSDKTGHAVITAQCGDQSVSCSVTCKPAPSTDVPDNQDKQETPDKQDDQDTTKTDQTTSKDFKAGSIGVVTGAENGLKIRSGPGTEYEALDSTTNGVQLSILGDAGNGWVKVHYTAVGGVQKTGYVLSDYITVK